MDKQNTKSHRTDLPYGDLQLTTITGWNERLPYDNRTAYRMDKNTIIDHFSPITAIINLYRMATFYIVKQQAKAQVLSKKYKLFTWSYPNPTVLKWRLYIWDH